jgi:dTDP-4-amino-4,6-dideoxygalactose transaminase
MTRTYLSPPDVGAAERELLLDAFDSGWIAPLGPHVDAFEKEFAEAVDVPYAVALSSGTAALHLALHVLGIGRGDEVLTSTMTFAATANAITYVGGTPAFVDVSRETWNLDPDLLEEALANRSRRGRQAAAVLSVDLYGQCADYARITAICARFGVPLIEDAAEALGATYGKSPAGSFGECAAFSFNGNKIITTSGGGALLGSTELADRARYLSTQARTPALHYEHVDIGFNYRMSNLLAALGRSQLAGLEPKIARRTEIDSTYRSHPDLAELGWCPYRNTDRPNHWLSVALLPTGLDPSEVCRSLATEGIEARPAWKPMHIQPVFADNERIGGTVAEDLFERGLCLPTGSALSDGQVDRVVTALAKLLAGRV